MTINSSSRLLSPVRLPESAAVFKRHAAAWLGPKWATRARLLLRGYERPRWGNLRRCAPFSTNFGFERGTPIDRHYVNRFFLTYADFISGRVLEIQQSGYTLRFGRSVSVRDTLDIDARFAPTHLCDLAKADRLVPSEMYDCFLLPNTAQHLRDLENALVQARRIVKPGGVILLTAAGFLPLIPDGPDYWRLTVDGWRELTARVWPDDDVEVTGYGNVLAAVAALHGIVCEELTEAELDVHDPRYPVTVGVCCRKQSDPIR